MKPDYEKLQINFDKVDKRKREEGKPNWLDGYSLDGTVVQIILDLHNRIKELEESKWIK
jgi:hypothetical protein